MQGFLKKDEVLDAVHGIAKGPATAISFLTKMEDLAGIYLATFYRDHERWNKYPDAMRPAIQTLNFFHIHPFRPALLSVAAMFPPKEATKAFQMFISLGVRLIIASSTRSGVIEESLAAAACKVYKGDIKTTGDLIKELSGIIPSNEQFRQAFEIAPVSKAPFARYYLRALERVAKREDKPWFIMNDDKEVITLEHVLPEKPEGNWPQFTPEEVEIYCNRLGNLALLHFKDNSTLQSKSDTEKFAVYKDCPYELTAEIATVPRWTVETICKRQSVLADSALKAWPINS